MFLNCQMNLVTDPLAELASMKSVFVKQQIELLEIITGCETPNRYHVYGKNLNGWWSYLFKCKEESSWCERNCCYSEVRPFKMKVKHVINQQQFTEMGDDTKLFAIFDRPFKCTCLCLDRLNILI
jgi:hypothetical protein